MVLALQVKKNDAEKARRFLFSRKLINFNYHPSKSGDYVLFPLIDSLSKEAAAEELQGLKDLRISFSLVECKLEKRIQQEKIDLPPFDIIGSIAIFELPKEFKDAPEKEKEKIAKKLAQNIMRQHKNIKTVAVKTGGVKGPFRIRSFKVIAGKRSTKTIHKEHGCIFELDVSKMYYSPRLSYERKRINSLIRAKETVFVPFAGVGPFAIIIAKHHPDSIVYANELNPDAYKYLLKNIKLNKTNNVIPIPGDARDLKINEYKEIADRVVMPIPMSADQFLDVAFHLAKKGGIVHFYYFTDSIENAEKVVKEASKSFGRKVKIINSRIVRDYSVDIVEVVVDFQILD